MDRLRHDLLQQEDNRLLEEPDHGRELDGRMGKWEEKMVWEDSDSHTPQVLLPLHSTCLDIDRPHLPVLPRRLSPTSARVQTCGCNPASTFEMQHSPIACLALCFTGRSLYFPLYPLLS